MLNKLLLAAFMSISFDAPLLIPAEPAKYLSPQLELKLSQIRWTPERITKLIAGLPKIETHVHLDGTLSAATIRNLAIKQRYAPLLGKTEGDIRKLAVVTDPRADLASVLKAFNTFYGLLRTPEALEEISYQLVASERAQNIRYFEVRFAPALQATPEFPVEEVLKSALRGLQKGKEAFGVGSGVIICLYRPLSPAENDAMFKLAAKYFGHGVVGIDLAGDEAKNPLSQFKDFFRRAKALGIFTTVHAGEVPGSGDLELALQLGVDRISHATLLSQKPDLLEEIARRRIPIEVNLTSNLRTGAIKSYAEHPAKQWFDAGIPINLSTDDPGVFGIDLAHEYRILLDQLHFSIPELLTTIVQSIDGLFLSPEDKAVLRKTIEADIENLVDHIHNKP